MTEDDEERKAAKKKKQNELALAITVLALGIVVLAGAL